MKISPQEKERRKEIIEEYYLLIKKWFIEGVKQHRKITYEPEDITAEEFRRAWEDEWRDSLIHQRIFFDIERRCEKDIARGAYEYGWISEEEEGVITPEWVCRFENEMVAFERLFEEARP
jgi:hypothetical protein